MSRIRGRRISGLLTVSVILAIALGVVLVAARAERGRGGWVRSMKGASAEEPKERVHFGGAPYPESPVIESITFHDKSLRTAAPGSDNWPVTWAANDVLFTAWGDGGGFGGSNRDGRVSLGVARVDGDRSNYFGTNVAGGTGGTSPAPFPGKSVGILAIEDTLYLWRNGDSSNRSAFKFSQLYRSEDLGASWKFTGIEFSQREGDFKGADEGFFAPTFCHFGKGYSENLDGYVWVYAPEITDRSHWDLQRPGRIALLRVPVDGIETKSAYEFLAGVGADGTPIWTKKTGERGAVWEDPINGVHRMAVSYNSGLDRFLLTTMAVDRTGWFALYDSPSPWGPWSIVLVEQNRKRWGSKVVVFNFVNKWLRDGGRDFVLVYTRNDSWATIEGKFGLYRDAKSPETLVGALDAEPFEAEAE